MSDSLSIILTLILGIILGVIFVISSSNIVVVKENSDQGYYTTYEKRLYKLEAYKLK